MLKKQLKINFKHNKEPVKLVVVPEDYRVSQQLKTEYAVAFRRAITMGVATRASMMELLKREGVWTDVEEQKLIRKTLEASLLEEALRMATEEGDDTKAKETALELVSVRGDVYELVQIKHLPLEHTAESIAEDVRLDVYITLCTKYADSGKPYFKDMQDFLNRRTDKDVEKIYDAVVTKLSEDNVELMRKLPENQWLMDHNYIDKDGNGMVEEITKLFTDDGVELVFDDKEEKEKEKTS